MYITTTYYPNYISHHGILGMKWGIRRYQNEDGSYTERGLKRRAKLYKKIDKAYDKETRGSKAILANESASKFSKDRAKNYMEKRQAYRDLRRAEVDTTMNYAENRMKGAAIAGGILAGPWGAVAGSLISAYKNKSSWEARGELETVYGDVRIRDI